MIVLGWINDMDALILGQVTWKLGAGRNKASDPIDHTVGLRLIKQVGHQVDKNEAWVEVAHTSPVLSNTFISQLQTAIAIQDELSDQPPLLIDLIA